MKHFILNTIVAYGSIVIAVGLGLIIEGDFIMSVVAGCIGICIVQLIVCLYGATE